MTSDILEKILHKYQRNKLDSDLQKVNKENKEITMKFGDTKKESTDLRTK